MNLSVNQRLRSQKYASQCPNGTYDCPLCKIFEVSSTCCRRQPAKSIQRDPCNKCRNCVEQKDQGKRQKDAPSLQFESRLAILTMRKEYLHTESRISPSPRGYAIGFSISDLYRNKAITAEIRLDAERRMATKPATRETSSRPGSVMNVTEALRIIAA